MIGTLLGKAMGEVVALPLTVGAEVVKAAEAAAEQTAKAVDRATGGS